MNLQDSHLDDGVNVAPDLHTILYEDEKMRVLKVVVPAGAEAKMHWHPHNINYVLAGGVLQFTKPDGVATEVRLEKGQVTFSTTESSHTVKNIGTATVETIQVELKY